MKVTVTVTVTVTAKITTSRLSLKRARTLARKIIGSDGDGRVGRSYALCRSFALDTPSRSKW